MMLGSRYSQHRFSQTPDANVPRSVFNRSHTIKDTFYVDELVPFFCDEVLPGDTVNLSAKTFIRLAPQVRPLMDNLYFDFYFFFAANRYLWDNWEKFMGAQDNPGDSIDYILPTVTFGPGSGGAQPNTIYDHFGLPTGKEGLVVQSLPFRAHNKIWNDWFRDQNLQSSAIENTDDGPDGISDFVLRKNAKKHDYFTSALPFLQKGNPVSLLTGFAPVVTDGTVPTLSGNAAANQNLFFANSPGRLTTGSDIGTGGSNVTFGNNTGLRTDLAQSTVNTINTFRLAIMTQGFLELNARSGTRLVEVIRAHFNVVLPDYTAQRPEFLSGATVPLQQHPVAQTSETDQSPQGNLAAFSTAAEFGNKIGFSKSFVEHGYVLGFVRARGEVTYQQGLHRMWTRSTRLDFFWPKFQELGEQAILNKEIYFQGTAGGSADNGIFGYIPRYDDYRFAPSSIRGQFRSEYVQSLDVWHLAEEFSSLPGLNNTFIQGNTPLERVLEVPDENYPHFLMDVAFDIKHARPMVANAVPATLGRF